MPDAPMDDGLRSRRRDLRQRRTGARAVWRERATQPTDIDVPRDGVAIQAMAT
jgi:hypothetical protein